MHKRPHSDSEVSAEEADSSEISKPATKIIRVDDSPRSSSDKCIQVDSAAEATGEPGGLPGPSTSAITNSNVDAATAEEDNAIDLVSSNTNHSSTSTETTIRCSNNDASTDDPTTITTSTTTSSTTATSSSSSIDDTCEPSCDIAPSHDETPSASPNSTEPTSSIEEGEIYQDQPLNEDAVTVDDAVIEEVPSYAEEQAVATSSSSVNASLDEPDMTPSTSSGIRHVPSRRTQSILKTAERKLKGKRSVVFNGVTVYYFRRSQGFTCIPSQGGSTLGMENSHTYIRNFTLETHAEERKRAHREILQRQRRFARMNKHSSTSESEDDSYDDMSDLSDVDLENDNCYFLQPVPIKQRRALLRASGVRKIETSEKEECRDIRISREFCGCECQVYCNPEICACYLAGIKCQVDRMAFPCGCSKDGCHNENGRIEFNPMRVRTHFIHTIMKIEMEKKQEQQQQQQQQQQMASSTSNGGGMISTISSTDGAYCGAPCTSSYSSPISNQCSQSMQQGMYAMPMVHNNTAHSGHHYISESSHMHLMPPNNSYADPNIYHTNEYSPDSSYSENSDYTTGSDEFENENGEKTDDSPVNVVTSHEMYSQHQHQQQQQQQQPHPSSHQYASNGQDMMHSCANSNALPPFPSINSSCDLSAGGAGYTKNGHCHSYQQDSGGANSMHLNHYNSYSAMTDSLPQPPQQQQPSQHASLYSYDIHSSSSHYTSYSNGFHKGEPNFASMGTGNVAVATTSHLSAETSPPLEHPQQQHQHQHQQQQQQQQPVNSSSQQQMVGSEGNSIAAPAPQQQYIDLSLSIASSSSAESLLSAANTSDEDSRLTPVSFTHIQPLSSSSSFYTVVTNNSSSLGHHPYDHQDYSAKGTSDHHLLPQCSSIAVSAPYGELSEADPKSSSSSSDSSSESNLSSSDNFGEIIKKSIVETDIFSPRPPSSASASPSMSVEAPSSGPCDPSPTSHATQQGTNMPSTAAAANEDSVLFATPLGPAPKRRGRPPKNVKVPKDEVDSTETENTDSTVLLPASQGESRRRSSRLKKLEKEKEPDLNGISNGHTLSNTHHTASKEKSKSKKHRHHKKHELDHPTATTDCQITAIAEAPQPQPINAEKHDEPPKELESSSKVLLNRTNEVCNESYPKFEEIDANIFCCERKKSKGQKEIKKMVCDCILSKEDRINGFRGCGDDCLNRMLMIECGSRCTLGDLCSNKRFSLKQYAKVEPFKTLNKGWGLRTLEDLPPHSFIMEYVGEVVDAFDFYKRVEKYEKRKTEHHYFMVLQADEFIDATRKGNVTRFINHSCDPNSQTEKWTVNGELRVGFFTFKHVKAGEEITFDYQFQRYGKKAQKCFCGTDKCCGYIGGKSANILTDGSKIPTKANKSKKKTKKVSPVKVKDEFKEGGDEEEEKEEEEEEDDDDEEEEDNDEDDDLYNGVDLDEEQISNLEYEQRGLRNRQTTLEVSQIMIRTEKMHLKLRLIKIIMSTVEIAYLRLFLDYYGLKIIRNWMLSTGNDAEDIQLKARLLELLMILPIPNKTMLIHNKVLETVERWAQSDSPESSQYINPPNADATNKVNGDDVGGDGENGVKEESEEAKKSSAEELPKLAEKLVTKSSAKEETEKSSPTAEENITIGQLAQKVLDHWKDLIFVLRIPRLEIEKRHADEAEADRKTKEDEDKQTHQTPASAALKRPNEEEYHAGGHKRRFLRSLTDAGRDAGAPRRPFTGNHNHTSSNHRDDTASAATLAERQQDKEHRRRMFEYNEYQNAVIKWRKQMDDYNMQVLEISPLMALQQLENGSPLSVDSQSLATSITPGSASTLLHPQLSSPLVPGQAPEASGDSSENPTSIEKMYDKETEAYLERKEEEEVKIELTLKDIVPKFDSPLIILLDDDSVPAEKDVTLSPHAIDNVDYNEVRYYCDDVFESMEKRLFDEIYPPQGIFYIAPTGETYFLSMPSDLSQSVTVRENVAEPLPLSYTKRTSANIMLPLNCDWSCAEVEGETYYFNKHKQIKQWNPPQSNQIGTFTPMIAIPESKPLPLRIKRNKELVDLEQNFEKHIPVENRQHLFRIRRQLSAHVVKCLSPYNRRDCKHGRITSHEDFKYLARKITHHVIYKEYQHQSTIGKPIDKMVCSDSVKGKTKEYVKAYMNKYKREYRLS